MSDGTAQQRLAALQAEAYSVAEDNMANMDEIKEAIKMCIGSGMWTWTRQPVPQLCDKLLALYLASGNDYRAFRVAVKTYLHIMPVLNPLPFSPERLIHAWSFSRLTNRLCGPAGAEVFSEMLQSGIHLWFVCLGLLFETHDNISRMYGPNTTFGLEVNNTYDQVTAGLSLGKEETRAKIAEVWTSLEMLARNVTAESL